MITFEKKHFLMLGLVIAIPFLFMAIANIMAAAPSGQYHFFSELFVDQDIDMNNNKITNLSVPTISVDAATKGYVDASGGGSSGTYKVFAKCTGCTASSSWCTPSDETAPICPLGWSEIYFAKHNTDFSTLGSLYTNPETVTDVSLSASHAPSKSATCSATANVVDKSGVVLASYTATKGTINSYNRCVAWCSYRICQPA